MRARAGGRVLRCVWRELIQRGVSIAAGISHMVASAVLVRGDSVSRGRLNHCKLLILRCPRSAENAGFGISLYKSVYRADFSEGSIMYANKTAFFVGSSALDGSGSGMKRALCSEAIEFVDGATSASLFGIVPGAIRPRRARLSANIRHRRGLR